MRFVPLLPELAIVSVVALIIFGPRTLSPEP